jgi:hypothetical protein
LFALLPPSDNLLAIKSKKNTENRFSSNIFSFSQQLTNYYLCSSSKNPMDHMISPPPPISQDEQMVSVIRNMFSEQTSVVLAMCEMLCFQYLTPWHSQTTGMFQILVDTLNLANRKCIIN